MLNPLRRYAETCFLTAVLGKRQLFLDLEDLSMQSARILVFSVQETSME